MTTHPSPHEAARTATEADIPVVVALAGAAADEKRGQKGGPLWFRRERRQGPPDAELKAAITSADHEIAVGTIDGTIVGYGLVRAERLGDGSLLGVVDDILVGVVWEFDITQTWAITALTLLAMPIFMIVLSMTLPARANRITNLIVASVQVPFAAFNAVGELGGSWIYFYGLGVALEVILLVFILRSAWTWPRITPSATIPTSRAADRAQQQA